MTKNSTTLSIVAPVYNEEDCIEEFYQSVRNVMDGMSFESELIFVNDGSSDRSESILQDLRRRDPRVKLIHFSRNFGHQVAIKSGIDHAGGQAVVTIDTDLQDPPEVIPEMVEKWKEGYDIVYAVRKERQGESFFKKVTASFYYRLIRRLAHVDIPLDAGDFRLISRPVVNALRGIQEKNPYLRGLISWLGFRQIGVTINRQPRYAGQTKYSLVKMLRLAWNGITHFSFLPLQIATFIGSGTALLCFLAFFHILYTRLILQTTVPGWASMMVAILFLGSAQLLTLGILGSYLAKNYDESRKRPLYVIRRLEGLDHG